ncbi:hypothetical protein MRX96_036042 [Rhipicephalus microplus]
MNVPECTPLDSSVSGLDQARCIPPAKLRQEYLDLLELVGHGRSQLRILFCAHLSLVMVLFHDWSTYVLTRPVDHWCKPPTLFAHLTRDQWLNVSVPVVEDSQGNRHHSQCAMYDLSTIVFNGSRLEVPCDGWDYDLPADASTVVSKWHLVCDRAPYVVMTHVYYTVGELLGAPLVGQLADRAGRRPMVFGALLMSMASVFTATAADSFPAFVVAHVLIALSTSTAHLLTSILLFESSSSAYRALYIAAAETGAPLVHAISLCPWLQHMDLRFTRIALVFSMILLSLAFHAVAESPRWMLAVGEYDALTSVLTTDRPGERVPARRRLASCPLCRGRQTTAGRRSLLPLLLLLVPVYATGYPLVVRWPRRTSLHMTLMVASTVGVAAGATHYYESPLVTEVMGLLLAMVQLCLLVAKLHAYECFPSAVRATAVHVVVAAGCLGQGMAQFLVDVARVADASSALLIMSVGLLSCELAIRWLPETKNVELPEVQAEVLSQECHPHQVTPPFKDEVLPAKENQQYTGPARVTKPVQRAVAALEENEARGNAWGKCGHRLKDTGHVTSEMTFSCVASHISRTAKHLLEICTGIARFIFAGRNRFIDIRTFSHYFWTESGPACHRLHEVNHGFRRRLNCYLP